MSYWIGKGTRSVAVLVAASVMWLQAPTALAEAPAAEPAQAAKEAAEAAKQAAKAAKDAAKAAERAAAAAERAAALDRDPAEAQAPEEGEKFVRFHSVGVGGELQTSIVSYRNEAGQQVDLIGAIHIGDRDYFQALNDRFTDYDVVLYEMVKPVGAAPPRADGPERQFDMNASMIGNFQVLLKDALELDFQLDRIDYHQPNFVHADLDAATFTRLQQDRNETFLDLFIKALLNPPSQAEMEQMETLNFNDLLMALQAPDRARQLKLLFAKQMRQMDQMTRLFDGPDGSVIIHERNKAAFKVLDAALADGEDKIGIFYGAAHLPDMEERLLERGFEQVGQPEYLTAWDMNVE